MEYAITPNWSVVGGYVQYQPYTTQIPALRGPFQDIAYGMDFGHLALANRVRMEELFFDTSGALLLRARYRLSAQHPIGNSPWSILVSDDSTSTSRPTARAAAPVSTGTNSTAGSILDIGRGAKLSAGYQFTTVEPTAGLNEYHTIKLGFAFALN